MGVRVRARSVPRRGLAHVWLGGGGAASPHPVRRRPPCGGWRAAWARRRPSAAHCGMKASSAPASRHKAAAWRASGSSCRPSDAPSKMPATWASRSAQPPGKVAEFSHRGGLLVLGQVAPSGVVPGGSGELGDQDPVSSRRGTILVHRARIERASGYLKHAGELSRQSCGGVAVGSDIRLRQSKLATLDLRAWFMLTGRLPGPDRLTDLSHAEMLRARRQLGPRRQAGWSRAGSRHGRAGAVRT